MPLRSASPLRRLVVVLLSTAIVAAGCGGGSRAQAGDRRFRAEGPAAPLPDDQLVEVDADRFEAMLVGLRGRPVLVNVWATWCVPCRAEAPLLRRLADAHPDLVVLGVHADPDVAGARAFLDQFGLDHLNVEDADGDVTHLLGTTVFPTTIAWDRDGTQRALQRGGFDEQRLAAMVAEVDGGA